MSDKKIPEPLKYTRIDPKTKWQPSEDQRTLLLALQGECAKEETVVAFARKFLPFTRSKFDQIMDVFNNTADDNGNVIQSYFDRVSDSVRERTFEELQFILDEIPLKRLQLSRINSVKIYPTSKILALEQAIREAKAVPGAERLVVNLGPTGSGKTIACNYLAKKVNARFVEVRDIWRHSTRGNVPLHDICKGVGMRSFSKHVAKCQDELVEFCGEQNIVIVFDEGEHFGKAALNLLKFLLNKTRLVPVIFSVPEEYDKWFNYYPNEAGQIARRTRAIIDSSVIDMRDVALFFPEDKFAKREGALELLAREASRFGHYSLVNRVVEKLEGVQGATTEDLRNAIEAAHRQMRRAEKTNVTKTT